MNEKIRIRAAALLFGLTLVLIGAAGGGAQPAQVVSNLTIPFNQSALVNNGDAAEPVDFMGSVHLVVKFTVPPDPITPPDPIRIHTNLMGVSGIGQTTGLRYEVTGAADFEFQVNAQGNFSFVGSYHLVPPSPIKGDEELTLPIRYNVVLNESGEVTQASASATHPNF